MLRLMMSVVPHFPDYQFVIAGAPSLSMEAYSEGRRTKDEGRSVRIDSDVRSRAEGSSGQRR